MISPRAWAVALALSVAAAGNADACSVGSRYRIPSGLDLATRAEVIVLATVTGERSGADDLNNVVTATPTDLIKGGSLPATVELGETFLPRDERWRRMIVPSDPRELRAPNPDTLTGGCVRRVFSPGMKLVLFLERDEHGVLTPIRPPFSRDAEDVSGPDALWVKAVREYAAIGAGSKEQVDARLAARAAALRSLGDADSLAIAADMEIERTRPPHPGD